MPCDSAAAVAMDALVVCVCIGGGAWSLEPAGAGACSGSASCAAGASAGAPAAVRVCTAGGGLSSGLSSGDAAGCAAAQPSDRASAAAQITNNPLIRKVRLKTLIHPFMILFADGQQMGKGDYTANWRRDTKVWGDCDESVAAQANLAYHSPTRSVSRARAGGFADAACRGFP